MSWMSRRDSWPNFHQPSDHWKVRPPIELPTSPLPADCSWISRHCPIRYFACVTWSSRMSFAFHTSAPNSVNMTGRPSLSCTSWKSCPKEMPR